MRTKVKKLIGRIVGVALLGLLSITAAVQAQEFRAAVTGKVTDTSEAVVVNAEVQLTNNATGVITTTHTNNVGVYSVDLLPIGAYKVEVKMSGFERAVEQCDLHTGDRKQIDIQLHPGRQEETITVTSTAPQLETATGDAVQVIETTQIADAPLIGRNPYVMANDIAGVKLFSGQNTVTATSPYANGGMDSYVVNGGLRYTADYLLDGLANSGIDTGGPSNLSFVPSPDQVQEIGVATSIYDARYGRSGGGIVSVNLKNGTNEFHGSASYYLRNEFFNANTYQNDLNHDPKGAFRWLEPGVEVDGPVFIPKLYDGRNKTFFMFGWEEIHNQLPAPGYQTVPTDLERGGDFSQSYNGGPLVIYDPLTTVQNGSTYSRTAFAGNKVPTARLDPVAQKILALIPHANVSGAGNVNNLFSSPNVGGDRYDAFTYRVDQTLNAKNRIFGAFMYNDRHQTQGLGGWPIAITPSYIHWRINHAAHLDWTWMVTNNLVNSLRVGWNQHNFFLGNYQQNYDLSSLGFSPATVAGLGDPTLFPNIGISGYSSFGHSPFASGLGNISDTFDLSESLIAHVKSHDLSFGGEIRPVRDSRTWIADNNYFNFNAGFTQANPLSATSGTGSGFASFLLGYPSSGGSNAAPIPYYSNSYYAAYLQDNWRINPKLTVTLGLRWDTETPMYERHNRQNIGFDPNAPYSFAGQQLFGKVLFAGYQGASRGAYGNNWNYFGPRLGFAERVSEKLVVRGGMGIIYAPVFNLPSESGFSASTNYLASTNNGVTPANTLSNPFPSGFTTVTGPTTNFTGQGGWTYWANNKANTPRVIQASLGIEYQLPQHALLNARYVLQRTSNISNTRNVNFLPASDLSLGTSLNDQLPNPFSGLLPGSFLDSTTVSRQQTLLPFPQYSGFSYVVSNATQTYNGLLVTLDKRMSHGVYGRVSYSYSKELTEGFLNDQDTTYTHELSQDDQPHMIQVTAGWHLPTPGSWESSPVLRQAMGWQFSGDYTAFPKGPLYTAPSGVVATGINPRVSNPTWAHEFNTCTKQLNGTLQNCSLDGNQPAWQVQAPYTLATMNPYYGALRMPESQLTDLELAKTFPIYERVNLMFRVQAFNLTNSPSFNSPDNGYSDQNFGKMTNYSQYNDPRELELALRLSW
jgi:hypothetical protein